MKTRIVITRKKKRRDVILKSTPAESRHKGTDKGKVARAVAKHIVDNKFKYYNVTILVALIVVALAVVLYTLQHLFPYAITVNGEAACYVRGEAGVEDTYEYIIDNYLPEGTIVKAVEIDDRLDSKRVSRSEVIGTEILSPKKAAALLLELFEDDEDPLAIYIASTDTKLEKYTPEPTYKKAENLIVGEMEVESKAKKGTQNVTRVYTSVNGEIESEYIANTEIVEEGTPAVILKGILGLPEGEDWLTYDGDPEYKDGSELAKYAQNYLGAPYRYGGYSLTNGIDCVQFVRQMYAKYGISLPNGHSGIQKSGVAVSYKNAKKGDIICYNGHMGIYIGNGKMINAVHRGVSISKVKTSKIKTVIRIVKE